MKIDRLNIDSFTTQGGKNYRRAEPLDLARITNYFSEKGYAVRTIKQPWRHVHGTLEKAGKTFFLKMASTPDIGERTENEAQWNEQIGAIIENMNVPYVAVPHIYATGTYEEKFYFLASYHGGALLTSKDSPQTGHLGNWIDAILKTNIFFLSLQREDFHFRRDQDAPTLQEGWDAHFQKIQSWYYEVEEHQLQKVWDAVEDLRTTFTPSLNHGDFVPWHMIQEGEKVILIDAEHASTQSPRYYDVCYFYHRLYTAGKNPELARAYLTQLRARLSKEERSTFDVALRPILAARIIGGFWDAKTDGHKDVTLHQRLKEDFLKNNLIE